AQGDHLLGHRGPGLPRRMLRPTRSILQGRDTTLTISLQPLVTGFTADAEPPTELTKSQATLAGEDHNLITLGHGGNRAPRHPMCYPCLRTSVTHVSGPYTRQTPYAQSVCP